MNVIMIGRIYQDLKGYGSQAGRVYDPSGLTPTLRTPSGGGTIPMILEDINIETCRVRRLTPRETWRLMGFEDKDFDAAKLAGVSDTQLYRQSGNSIVVQCLEGIFKNLLGVA